MNKKIALLTLAPLLVLASPAEVASGDDSKGFNSERGWNFGKGPESQQKDPADELAEIKKLLKELVAINKEMLSLQKKELGYEHETITVDGEECTANSSAKCYKHPLVAEARRVPVLAEWLKDPTDRKKAAKWLKWQAKWLNKVYSTGYGLALARKQAGESGYPVGAVTGDSDAMTTGKYLRYLEQRRIEILKEHASNMTMFILLGKSKENDAATMDNVVRLYEKYEQLGIDCVMVYPGTGSKSWIQTHVELASEESVIKKYNQYIKDVQYDKEIYESLNVNATPTVVLHYSSDEKSFTQAVGRQDNSFNDTVSTALQAMIYNGVVEPTELSEETFGHLKLREKIEQNTKNKSKHP